MCWIRPANLPLRLESPIIFGAKLLTYRGEDNNEVQVRDAYSPAARRILDIQAPNPPAVASLSFLSELWQHGIGFFYPAFQK